MVAVGLVVVLTVAHVGLDGYSSRGIAAQDYPNRFASFGLQKGFMRVLQ